MEKFECMHAVACKYSSQAGVSRLSSLSALKTANIPLSIYTCVWDLTSAWALTPGVTAELHSGCVSAHCHCWQTGHTGRAGGGCSHAILRPDSGQTWHRPLTGGEGGPSGAAARQLVCMSMFMEYAFMLAHKSWTCSPPSISRVSSYRGEQSGFFSILLWYCAVRLVQNLKTHFVKTHRFLQSCILQVINVQVLYCENTFFN